MTVNLEEIKRLRELTGVGMTDAKKALDDAKEDFDKALQEMRKKGLTKAEKREGREARAGVIGSYLHDNRIGVLVEINCETEFVARNELFGGLVKDIAMHIAASAPQFVSADDIPAEERERVTAEFTEKVKSQGKPENMIPQIVEGMLKKHFAEKCLLDQPFVKNPDQTVGDYLKVYIAKLGENLVVRRFERMALGETS
jgi:translation elongation factor EF-Ts